jgi:hypothetical protein
LSLPNLRFLNPHPTTQEETTSIMILNEKDYKGVFGKIKKFLMIVVYLSLAVPGFIWSLTDIQSKIKDLIVIKKIPIDEKEERVFFKNVLVRDKSRSIAQKVKMIEEPVYTTRRITTFRIEVGINMDNFNNPQVSLFKKILTRMYVLFKNGRTEKKYTSTNTLY